MVDPFEDGLDDFAPQDQSSQLAEPTKFRAPASSSPAERPSVTTKAESHSTTPVISGIPLVSLRQNLPDKLQAIFPYEFLNAVQSKCFDIVYHTNDNLVVAAPTGSGKTAILELAICKLALDRGNENFKIIYQAPTKALCSERARDWERKFGHMNLKCAELTGDTSPAEMRRVGDASIIVTTPEKWDSITRKWQDHRRLLQMVELFLIDEVHFLKDVRGATLEAVVSRMKTIGANVRFIALSATVPNSEDIAKWLGRNHTHQQLPAYREAFGEDFRPVKLRKFVYGFESASNDFMFDKFLDQKLPGLLSKHTEHKPILVFCFTRKSCESTAAMLAKFAASRPESDKLWPSPSQRMSVISRELQEIIGFGVAFHHAGLDAQDRNAVERIFLTGQLGVICCTSTLAVGINLPCHTVVLKGTVGFMNDKLEEYSDLEVMQMLGRAGRPQFDDTATAIILTRSYSKERYQKMVSGQEILESTLHLNLIEHLNSEICLRTIHGGDEPNNNRSSHDQPSQRADVTACPAAGPKAKRRSVQGDVEEIPRMYEPDPIPLPNIPSKEPTNDWNEADFDDMDIDCIDLSFMDDGNGGDNRNLATDRPSPSMENHLVIGPLCIDADTLHHDESTADIFTQSPNQGDHQKGVAIPLSEHDNINNSRQENCDYHFKLDGVALDNNNNNIVGQVVARAFKSNTVNDGVLCKEILNRSPKADTNFSENNNRKDTNTTPSGETASGCSASIDLSDLMTSEHHPGSSTGAEPNTSLIPRDAVKDDEISVGQLAKRNNEPDWVAEFDPEFVDMFRGYVTFV
ncbi:hypothetical protein VTH82DRAFT_4027 [Thermothelomyces myriococcoides]